MTEQPEPHSIDAEKSVLGAILMHGESIETAAEILGASDFYRHGHRDIFAAMLSLHHRRQPVEMVTLVEALRSADKIADANPAYLASLVDGMPRASNIAAYAKIVREKATLRELIQHSRRVMSEAFSAEDDAATVLDAAQSRLYEIAVDRVQGGFVAMPDIISNELLPLVDRLVQGKQSVSGVPSGLIDLDILTRGFQPSDLIILAARPSMGKTALAMSAALHASTVAESHVGVCSLEMSRLDLTLRAVIGEAQIDGSRVRSGRIYDSEWARWTNALHIVNEARLHIDDAAGITVNDIRARARRLKAQVGLDLLIVDYLQLVKPSTRGENRNVEMGEISAGLKGIAKDLNVPVLALSQLSRSCEARADKHPILSDLRDSGAIEQDADLVLMLYRDEVYNEQTPDAGIAEIGIAKHRNGPTGTVRVGFHKQQTRFFNLTGAAA